MKKNMPIRFSDISNKNSRSSKKIRLMSKVS